MAASPEYQFTTDWFSQNLPTWEALVRNVRPTRILEVGSFEGRSTCFLIERCAEFGPLQIDCVDTWAGGTEHKALSMSDVETRFDHNVGLAQTKSGKPVTLRKLKGTSMQGMTWLINQPGALGAYDLVYIDGSHEAPDVLLDAVLGFQLARVGGLLIFDDYLWSMETPGKQDLINMPKPAIDAFTSLYQRKLRIIPAPLYQLYTQKTAA